MKRDSNMDNINTMINLFKSGKSIVFWGAGNNNSYIIDALKRALCVPSAIIDKDTNKQGKKFMGIQIMSYEEASSKVPNMYIWVSEGVWKYQIIGCLVHELGFPMDRIINYEPVVMKRACQFVESGFVYTADAFQFCCTISGRTLSPVIRTEDNAVEDIKRFLDLRRITSKNISKGIDKSCEGCIEIRTDYYAENPKISTINYSPGGTCNLKCIYCISAAKESKGTWDKDIDFKLIIDTLRNEGVLSDDLYFEISPGETALNKNRKSYYKQFCLAHGTKVMTNGTVYDEDLAECLQRREVNLLVSVDAGTKETYKRIRGVDLYERLRINLLRYSKIAPGYVDLKYIFVPGENDDKKDIEGFVNLCLEIKPGYIFITYDIFTSIQIAPQKTVEAVRYLISLLDEKQLLWKINSEVLKNVVEK